MATMNRQKGRFLKGNELMFAIIILLSGTVLTLLFMRPENIISNINRVRTNRTSQTASKTVKTSAFRCPSKRSYEGMLMSQIKEDEELLNRYGFDQICGGTYIEMGALDGKFFSNSYVFNKALDWKGVLIEASPAQYEGLVKNRQNEIATINVGICGKEQDLHWVNKGPVGGFIEFASESYKERWWTQENIQNAQLIRCRTLKDVLFETVGDNFHFDFFSLDVEGAEYDALMSLDFDAVSFGVIFVEADGHNRLKNWAVRQLLTSNGYTFASDSLNSYWFVNSNFGAIYEDLIHNKKKRDN